MKYLFLAVLWALFVVWGGVGLFHWINPHSSAWWIGPYIFSCLILGILGTVHFLARSFYSD